MTDTRVILNVFANAAITEESIWTGKGTKHLRRAALALTAEGVHRVHIIASTPPLMKASCQILSEADI